MAKAIDSERVELSEYAPRITTMQIPTDKIREVIGWVPEVDVLEWIKSR